MVEGSNTSSLLTLPKEICPTQHNIATLNTKLASIFKKSAAAVLTRLHTSTERYTNAQSYQPFSNSKHGTDLFIHPESVISPSGCGNSSTNSTSAVQSQSCPLSCGKLGNNNTS
ncbi:unnamed protein product [Rhodiola kirilowii]